MDKVTGKKCLPKKLFLKYLIRNIHREQILDLKHRIFTVPTPSALAHSARVQKALGTIWKECSTGQALNVCSEQSEDPEIFFLKTDSSNNFR